MRTLGLLVILLAACGGDDSSDDGAPPADAPGGGTAQMIDWTIRSGGSETTCAAVGATEVHVTAAPEEGVPVDHTFQCVLVPGSLTLPAGRYAISAELWDGTGPQRLASAPAQAVTVPGATLQFVFDL